MLELTCFPATEISMENVNPGLAIQSQRSWLYFPIDVAQSDGPDKPYEYAKERRTRVGDGAAGSGDTGIRIIE